jgi:hypothetical protein
MNQSNTCPVRELLRTSLWGFLQTERVWLTQEESWDIIRGTYCPVAVWSNTFESAKNRWLLDEEAQLYSEILLTWFRNRTKEQKDILTKLEEKMRNFEKDTAEKLKQQILNSKK